MLALFNLFTKDIHGGHTKNFVTDYIQLLRQRKKYHGKIMPHIISC